MTSLSHLLGEFTLPKPMPAHLEQCVAALPTNPAAVQFVRKVVSARQAVADALGAPAPIAQIEALDAYLPLVAALHALEQTSDALAAGVRLPTWQWTACLGTSAEVVSGGLEFELCMALVARALASCNLAAATVAGASGTDVQTATNEASKALRTAAGSFELARDLCGAPGGRAIATPPTAAECSPRLLEAMAGLCVALASLCAVSKGEGSGFGVGPLAILRQDAQLRAAQASAALGSVGGLRAPLAAWAALVAASTAVAQLEALGCEAHRQAKHADALGYAAAALAVERAPAQSLEAALAGRSAPPAFSARGVRRALELQAAVDRALGAAATREAQWRAENEALYFERATPLASLTFPAPKCVTPAVRPLGGARSLGDLVALSGFNPGELQLGPPPPPAVPPRAAPPDAAAAAAAASPLASPTAGRGHGAAAPSAVAPTASARLLAGRIAPAPSVARYANLNWEAMSSGGQWAPLHVGFLSKRGQRRGLFAGRSWQERLFALGDDAVLRYYRVLSPRDSVPELRGSIDLRAVAAVDARGKRLFVRPKPGALAGAAAAEAAGRQVGSGEGMRAYTLEAQREFETWRDLISAAMRALDGGEGGGGGGGVGGAAVAAGGAAAGGSGSGADALPIALAATAGAAATGTHAAAGAAAAGATGGAGAAAAGAAAAGAQPEPEAEADDDSDDYEEPGERAADAAASAAGGAAEPAVVWECESCTFVNRKRRNRCDLCHAAQRNYPDLPDFPDTAVRPPPRPESALLPRPQQRPESAQQGWLAQWPDERPAVTPPSSPAKAASAAAAGAQQQQPSAGHGAGESAGALALGCAGAAAAAAAGAGSSAGAGASGSAGAGGSAGVGSSGDGGGEWGGDAFNPFCTSHLLTTLDTATAHHAALPDSLTPRSLTPPQQQPPPPPQQQQQQQQQPQQQQPPQQPQPQPAAIVAIAVPAVAVASHEPDEFCCPISHALMRDPVLLAESGITYERECIEQWLQTSSVCPTTNTQLQSKRLVSNYALKSAISSYADQRDSQRQPQASHAATHTPQQPAQPAQSSLQPPSARPHRASAVQRLVEMGFSEAVATRALDAHGGDVGAAAEALLNEGALAPSGTWPPPAQPQPRPPQPAVSRELATLLDFGFERARCEAALAATGGALDAATEMLISNEGMALPQPAPQAQPPLAVAVAHVVGTLPFNWELRHTTDGKPYYVDHNTHTTHWLLPVATPAYIYDGGQA